MQLSSFLGGSLETEACSLVVVSIGLDCSVYSTFGYRVWGVGLKIEGWGSKVVPTCTVVLAVLKASY